MDGELSSGGVIFQLTSADDSKYEGDVNSSKRFPGTYLESEYCSQKDGTCSTPEKIDTECVIKNPISITIDRGKDPATVSVDSVRYERVGGGSCTPNNPITIDGGAMKDMQ